MFFSIVFSNNKSSPAINLIHSPLALFNPLFAFGAIPVFLVAVINSVLTKQLLFFSSHFLQI